MLLLFKSTIVVRPHNEANKDLDPVLKPVLKITHYYRNLSPRYHLKLKTLYSSQYSGLKVKIDQLSKNRVSTDLL